MATPELFPKRSPNAFLRDHPQSNVHASSLRLQTTSYQPTVRPSTAQAGKSHASLGGSSSKHPFLGLAGFLEHFLP